MISYHNDPKIKAKYLERVRTHARMDHLVQGLTWENGKGCAIGCTLEAYDHSRYPIELGIPEELAHLEDTIFEKLTPPDAQTWPEALLSAIPVGVDLAPAITRIKIRILREVGWYSAQTKRDPWGVMDAVEGAIACLESGEVRDSAEFAAWSAASAELAAWSAASAASAAELAEASAAELAEAAESAAWAARAARAARSARAARAARSARSAAWCQIRDIVLEEVANRG